MLTTLGNSHNPELATSIRGINVYGPGDEKLGSVDDAIVDAGSGKVRYVVVNAGWLRGRQFVVPVDEIYEHSDDALHANLSKKTPKRSLSSVRNW
jgi:uncharacterized protein YrrD